QMLSSRCPPPYEVTCGEPSIDIHNEACITGCGDSRAIVFPPPVVVTFPGPLISTCPQESFVGTAVPEVECQTGSGGGGGFYGMGFYNSGGSYGGLGGGSYGGGTSRLGSLYRTSLYSGFGRSYFPFFSRGYYRSRFGNSGSF
ncbi:KRSC protein, partial [Pterocles burchelli]|nr:KRSC protein [Pterocles burchelli]